MRHEKGIGPELPLRAAHRAAHLIAVITGATVAPGVVDNDPGPHPRRRVEVRPERTSRLLGIDVDAADIRRLLEPLEFEVIGDGDRVEVVVPSHRLDVTQAADVAEEVARAHGYDRIEGRLPQASLPPFRPDPTGPRHAVRRVLAGLGLDEVVTHALIGPDDLGRAGYATDGPDLVRLYNPLSAEHSILRPVMASSLLGALAENARQRRADAWLFDVGKVYRHHPTDPTPRDRASETAGTGRYESWELGIILGGAGVPATPDAPARAADVATLKGIIDGLHRALGAPAPTYRTADDEHHHPHRHPGRSGLIRDAAGRPYGSLGEVHPRIAAAWDIPGRPVDAAIGLDRLLALVPDRAMSRPVPAAQPIDRDLAVVVNASTPVGDLLRVARSNAGPLLDELRLFDVYRGAQIGDGKVSYAVALRFQPVEPGDEKGVEKAMNKIRGSLRHHLGAEIR